ncbi:MAG: 7-carboxy-7-deazaguanine synthase QueE [Bryobacterales bacterium]|nr:7-carboxy-7-deazaguanine synthase QueE [Bryobacterales bacterium]
MILSEIFYSIQGEGMLAGTPAAFLCLAGGPPRQTWRHPPRQRWKPESEEDVFLGPLLAKVRRQWYAHAVITGGEPLEDAELGTLTDGLRRIDNHVTIETSGTIAAAVTCDLMSINVSLRNPAIPRKGKDPQWPEYDVESIRQLLRAYDYQLKFALTDRAEMEEVVNLVREVDAERHKVLLLPAGPKAKDLKEQREWMIEASFFFGYRFAPRL